MDQIRQRDKERNIRQVELNPSRVVVCKWCYSFHESPAGHPAPCPHLRYNNFLCNLIIQSMPLQSLITPCWLGTCDQVYLSLPETVTISKYAMWQLQFLRGDSFEYRVSYCGLDSGIGGDGVGEMFGRSKGKLAPAFFQRTDPALDSRMNTPTSMSIESLVKSSLSRGSRKTLATGLRDKDKRVH